MEDEEPELEELIEKITCFNCEIIRRYIDLGAEMIMIPEDLGMQSGPMISIKNFRKYIKPSYQKMMNMAREAGRIVHMHSDGDIRALCDDIIEGGVDVLNLQDLVNGIDWIAQKFRGKTAVELDIDRQDIIPHGTPEQIDSLIREEVEKISTPQGGLAMVHEVDPGVPLANIKAVMDAMERYAFYYS